MAKNPIKSKVCSTPDCGNIIADYNKSERCARCASSLRYWSKVDPAKVTERQAKLEFWGGRLNFFVRNILYNHKSKKPRS